MKQVHILVSGYVQGVWYRKFVKTNALKLGLTGWVRNIPEGKVEARVEGQKRNIEKLIEFCQKGPPFAEVKNVEVEWDPTERSGQELEEKFKDFTIR